MPIRKIAAIGHPVLREPARALSREELLRPETQALIDDLEARGARSGLEAPSPLIQSRPRRHL